MKNVFLAGTALVGAALLASQSSAQAANIVISGATAATQTLNTGDTLTVTNTGSITANPAVSVTNVIAGFIDNSGNISGTSPAAILITGAGGGLTGGINNSGTIIDGVRNGIGIQSGASVSGGIINRGTISGENNGFDIDGTSDVSGGIDNSGLIKGGVMGIVVGTQSDISGGLTNSGTISGDEEAGIWIMSNSNISTGLRNSDTISGGFYGILLTNSDIAGGIGNRGTISGGKEGIAVDKASDISGGIDNSGTISGGRDGIVVDKASDISGGIDNSGAISASSTGISVAAGSDISGGIDNSGTIFGRRSAGIFVNNSDISGGVANTGTISGEIGINVTPLLSGTNSAITGGITNSGTIEGTEGTAISLNGLSASTPININGGRIIGDVTDNAPATGFSPVTVSGDFTTEGNFDVSSLTVAAGKTLTIGGSNTVTLDQMPASAGTFAFRVDNSATFGRLVVTGGAINLTGSTILADVGAGALANGDELRIGDGSAPAIGGPGGTLTAVADNSFLWDFALADGTAASTPTDDTDLFLFVSRNPAFSPATPGNGAVLNTLLGLALPINPTLQLTLTGVNTAPTAQTLNEILESLQPSVDGAAMTASLNVLDTSLDLVSQWLEQMQNRWDSGVASGNSPDGGMSGWGQVFGQVITQQERDNIDGYDASAGGFAMGLDTDQLVKDAVMGLAVSYGHTQVQSDNATRTDTGVNDYQVTFYGDFDLGQKAFLRGMAAYARGDAITTRHDVGGVPGLTARGDYASNQYTVRAVAGRGFRWGPRATVTPDILAHWTHYDPADYAETGAGGANLTVNQKAVDIAELGAGLDVSWDLHQKNGGILMPALQAGYRYDLIGNRVEATSAFTGGGAAFTSIGPDPARSRFNLSAEMTYISPDKNWDVKAGYNFDYKSGYDSHSGLLRSALRF